MPQRSLRPCNYPGCGELVSNATYCDEHRKAEHRRKRQQYGDRSEHGYDRAWMKARAAYLRAHPLCECPNCQAGAKRVTKADVVDHIIPHRGDKRLFWDESNWQAMSKQCHDLKTVKHDGGFGRPRSPVVPAPRGRGVDILQPDPLDTARHGTKTSIP